MFKHSYHVCPSSGHDDSIHISLSKWQAVSSETGFSNIELQTTPSYGKSRCPKIGTALPMYRDEQGNG